MSTRGRQIKLCKVCRRHLDARCYAFHFCRKSCYNEHKYAEYIKGWLVGKETGGGKGRISRYVRRWLFEKRGRQCEKCEWSRANPATGKVPIEINHINGNSDDHRPQNLELLCPNCHSLTSNYGSLNNGNGRKTKKKSAE